MRLRHAMVAVTAAALPVVFAGSAQANDSVTFPLNELNGSGAHAEATFTVLDGDLHVQISGKGFTPERAHAQHIHGAVNGTEFVCPGPESDTNGDGQVATEEGLPAYGDIFLSLTTKGDTSPASGLAVERMPVADAEGMMTYDRVIPAEMLPAGTIENLANLHIVQHGLDVNGNDTYDFEALGESVFAASKGVEGVPEEATNPATCGMVTPHGGVETGGAGTQGPEQLPLAAFGGLALFGTAGAFAVRRRLTRQTS